MLKKQEGLNHVGKVKVLKYKIRREVLYTEKAKPKYRARLNNYKNAQRSVQNENSHNTVFS